MAFISPSQKKWSGPKDSPYKLDKNFKEIQDDLNPCPICGAKPRLIFPFRHHKNPGQSLIRCSNCGAHTVADTMYRAICDWNSDYVLSKEDIDPIIYQYDINYFDDNSIDYFYSHVICGHRINGETIYAA